MKAVFQTLNASSLSNASFTTNVLYEKQPVEHRNHSRQDNAVKGTSSPTKYLVGYKVKYVYLQTTTGLVEAKRTLL